MVFALGRKVDTGHLNLELERKSRGQGEIFRSYSAIERKVGVRWVGCDLTTAPVCALPHEKGGGV